MYRIASKNFRNDYAFAIALQQLNGFTHYDVFPFALSTLPPDCKVIEINDNAVAWQYGNNIGYIENQDLHVMNTERFIHYEK